MVKAVIAILGGSSIFLLLAPHILTMRGGGRRGDGRGRKKNGISINVINLLYYLHHTLDMFRKKKKASSIQSNCRKSYIPDYMAVFLAGKPHRVQGGFLVCPMLFCMVQHIIKQHSTGSKLAHRRALKRNNELRGS